MLRIPKHMKKIIKMRGDLFILYYHELYFQLPKHLTEPHMQHKIGLIVERGC